jgi:hypothetical protein
MWFSHEMRNIDNSYMYTEYNFLCLDSIYKVGVTDTCISWRWWSRSDMVKRWLLSNMVKELLASWYSMSILSREAASARLLRTRSNIQYQGNNSMARSTKGVYLMRHPFRVKLGIKGGIQITCTVQKSRGLGQVGLTLRILLLKVRASLGHIRQRSWKGMHD